MVAELCVKSLNNICLLSVHPCDKETKGGCDQICNKDGDDAVCSCNEPDYKLGEDGKSCEEGDIDF